MSADNVIYLKEMKTFVSGYPCGPCHWENGKIKCECGWVYSEEEVVEYYCDCDECEICSYCGSEKCPKCGAHLHCGGCV